MNKIVKIILSLLIGIVGGASMVYIGVGPSFMVSAMYLTNVIENYRTSVGTMNLVSLSPFALFPAYKYYQEGNLDIMIGIYSIIGFFIGTYITSKYYLNSIKVEILYLLFGIYSILTGFLFIKKSKYIF
jgi:uncharacterized membrane protein YfcA